MPNLTRRRFRINFRRERLELSDGDFVDLDFAQKKVGGNEKLDTCLLILHGLEGSSQAPYVKSLIKAAHARGLDAVALNMRGCSGPLNRLPSFYHSGDSGVVAEAVVRLRTRFRRVGLLGFSLGGNVALKFVGENGDRIKGKVFATVGLSVPVDLAGAARKISSPGNRFYMQRFLRLLGGKIEAKAKLFPSDIDPRGVRGMRTFAEFDGAYTAPLNGFASAEDYWQRCSARNWLDDIRIPTLLLNARNDPFLSESCFPDTTSIGNPMLYSNFPDNGGHLGFPGRRRHGASWHERCALDFMQSVSDD